MKNEETHYTEECRGCNSYDSYAPCIPSIYNQDTNKCPCRICLIKGICIVPCEDLTLFMEIDFQYNYNQGRKVRYGTR